MFGALLVIGGIVLLVWFWGRRSKVQASQNAGTELDSEDLVRLAHLLHAEQEDPAPGEWEAIASVLANRMRAWNRTMAQIIGGDAPSPWNNSSVFKHRLELQPGTLAMMKAAELATLWPVDTVQGALGFIHSGSSTKTTSWPKWIEPVAVVIPTRQGHFAIFGGRRREGAVA